MVFPGPHRATGSGCLRQRRSESPNIRAIHLIRHIIDSCFVLVNDHRSAYSPFHTSALKVRWNINGLRYRLSQHETNPPPDCA